MLIFSSKRKVPLKAKDGVYKIKSGRKVLLTLQPSIERLFVFYLYGSVRRNGDVAMWLREYYKKNITPMEIDEIIEAFKKDHPAEENVDFTLKDIPLYATEKEGLALPIPRTSCMISKTDEKDLLEIIAGDKPNKMFELKYRFYHIREKYGLDFRKQVGKENNQNEELVFSFLNQHGLNGLEEEKERKERENRRKGKIIDRKARKVEGLFGYLFAASVLSGIFVLPFVFLSSQYEPGDSIVGYVLSYIVIVACAISAINDYMKRY